MSLCGLIYVIVKLWVLCGCHFPIYLIISLCVRVWSVEFYVLGVIFLSLGSCCIWFVVFVYFWSYWTYCIKDLDFLSLKSLMFGSLIFLCILCTLRVYCVVQYMFQEFNLRFNMCSKSLMCVIQFVGLCVWSPDVSNL